MVKKVKPIQGESASPIASSLVDNRFKGFDEIKTIRHTHEGSSKRDDKAVQEYPIALVYNGISYAVMMATPIDLYDFALGFSLSEGIVRAKSDIFDFEINTSDNGISIALKIPNSQFSQLKEKRRTLAGTAGCGLCGVESIEQALKELITIEADLYIEKSAIDLAQRTFSAAQALQAITGGIHGAAWCNTDGVIQYLREDIGRHNAMDKLIGCMAANGVDVNKGFAMTSSRLSYELVQKANSVGIACLIAVSAPSSLAIKIAEQARMTIIGFVRENQFVIYTHPSRVNG